MKIIAPVKCADDAEILLSVGADELFGSVFDADWENRFGSWIEFNRRGCYGKLANAADWDEIHKIINVCKKNNATFSLAVNALRFCEEQYSYIYRIMKRFHDCGGEKIIISDVCLYNLAKSIGFSVTISSCANCFSQESAEYFYRRGCRSIIFPRNMTIEEMSEIKNIFPEIEFEAFGMYSGCRFNDGCCLGLHNTKFRELCNYCDTGDWSYERVDGEKLTEEMKQWTEVCRDRFSRMYKLACSQCAIYRLLPFIDRLKVLERAGSVERLKKAVEITKKNIMLAQQCNSEEEYLASMLKPTDIRCDEGLNCYYKLYR